MVDRIPMLQIWSYSRILWIYSSKSNAFSKREAPRAWLTESVLAMQPHHRNSCQRTTHWKGEHNFVPVTHFDEPCIETRDTTIIENDDCSRSKKYVDCTSSHWCVLLAISDTHVSSIRIFSLVKPALTLTKKHHQDSEKASEHEEQRWNANTSENQHINLLSAIPRKLRTRNKNVAQRNGLP